MAMDPRKRQKKLERRKAKEKAKRKALAQRGSDVAGRIERAAAAPILHCCTTNLLWDQGMSSILVSRELNSGNVAYAAFLLDVYCLGVKDAMYDVVSRHEYDWKVYGGNLFRDQEIVKLEPEAARKLVEGAVEYARDLGLSPHRDYRKAKLIFGDINADSCEEEFVYGHRGKPHFIAGPHDKRERCDQIISILANRCGPDEFHYTIPIEGEELLTILETPGTEYLE